MKIDDIDSTQKPSTSIKYWIPKGEPYHLQVALSISGSKPWRNASEHRIRIEDQLLELARDWEYEHGEGAALRIAKQEVPDSNVYGLSSSTNLEELIAALMNSDSLQLHCTDAGIYDEELQGACQESMFQDRLADLVRLA
jgi:hypothetical protein